MSIGVRIQELRKSENLTQKKLADLLGVAPNTIGMYEQNRRSPDLETVVKMSEIFNVSADYLLSGKKTAPITPIPEILPVTIVDVPLLGDVACGVPALAMEEWETYPVAMIRGMEKKIDFCLRAKGESMIGAGIKDGDIVLVRKQVEVENKQIAVVLVNDEEATLKRVYYNKEKGELTLVAENPEFPPMQFRGEELEHIHILGRAVQVVGEL